VFSDDITGTSSIVTLTTTSVERDYGDGEFAVRRADE
jgi:hypothetical protein